MLREKVFEKVLELACIALTIVYTGIHTHQQKGKKMNTTKMIDRAVSKGANRAEAEATLAELIATHSEMNLPVALAWHGFVSNYMAEKMQLALCN